MPEPPHNTLSQKDFARLLMQVQPKVSLYIRAMVFNPTDVDDLAQEVAAKACERLESYDPSRSFEAWMITLARYEVLGYIKRRQRDRLVFDEHLAERLEQTLHGMSQRGDLLSLDALERCLTRVRKGDQELLRQRFELNMTGTSIAEALNTSAATISRRFSRLYSQLLVCVRGLMREEAAR